MGAERFDWAAAARRRADAAHHLPPLACPGRCRDPLTDCTCCEEPEPELSERELDASAATATLLLANGTPPIMPTIVIRALWWRGHHHNRQLQDWLRQQMREAA